MFPLLFLLSFPIFPIFRSFSNFIPYLNTSHPSNFPDILAFLMSQIPILHIFPFLVFSLVTSNFKFLTFPILSIFLLSSNFTCLTFSILSIFLLFSNFPNFYTSNLFQFFSALPHNISPLSSSHSIPSLILYFVHLPLEFSQLP